MSLQKFQPPDVVEFRNHSSTQTHERSKITSVRVIFDFFENN